LIYAIFVDVVLFAVYAERVPLATRLLQNVLIIPHIVPVGVALAMPVLMVLLGVRDQVNRIVVIGAVHRLFLVLTA
jgi:hypothetical protein